MKVVVWGGAGEHGRSCYYIQNEDFSVLLDCGGKKEKGGIYPLLDKHLVSKLNAVFLSHAHEDHSMGLPLLYKLGFKGEVWTSKATVAQLPAYFSAWIKYVQVSGGQLPYDLSDIERIRFRYLEDAASAMQWFPIVPGIRACWGASGHMVGSVWLQLEIGQRKVFFTGDYCAEPHLLHLDPPLGEMTTRRGYNNPSEIDCSIVDAAYGPDSDNQAELVLRIMNKISQVLDRGGHVLLPVPLFGRGQELIMLIGEQLRDVPIAIEPEIAKGFNHFMEWPEWLCPGALDRIKEWMTSNRFVLMTCEADRLEALQSPCPHIIFTTDGMLQSDISRWYYTQLKENALNAILFTGHLSKESYGASINGSSTCEVVYYRFKIHQGMPDVCNMLKRMPAKKTLLVHAHKEKTDLLRDSLTNSGYQELYSLSPGESIEI